MSGPFTDEQIRWLRRFFRGGPRGAPGSGGPTGAQGPQGTDGIDGADGPQGPQGVAGPQGVTGSTGSQGSTGAQGTIGAQGATGPQGVAGPQGVDGADGADGAQGSTGSQGATGAQGSAGPQGSTGSQGSTGAQGASGIMGVQGPQGSDGADGVNGLPGGAVTWVQAFSATTAMSDPGGGFFRLNNADPTLVTQIAFDHLQDAADISEMLALLDAGVLKLAIISTPYTDFAVYNVTGNTPDTGFTVVDVAFVTIAGTPFVASENTIMSFTAAGLQGPQGFQGVSGSTGAQGASGAQGPQGATGTTGSQGSTGAQGVAGPQGVDGATGPQGFQGIAGAGTAPTIRTITTNDAATTADYTILVDASGGDVTLTLPAAGDTGVEGLVLVVKKIDATSGLVVIDPDGSEQIEGDTTLTIPYPNDAAMVQSDGTEWWIV